MFHGLAGLRDCSSTIALVDNFWDHEEVQFLTTIHAKESCGWALGKGLFLW